LDASILVNNADSKAVAKGCFLIYWTGQGISELTLSKQFGK
jgi:hypothetical protein